MKIPVISLWQPWANWVALGWKPVETRLHKRFASLVGKRIGIHVALRWDKTALDAANPYLTPEQYRRSKSFLKMGGAIICTAIVKEFRKLTAEDSKAALIDCGKTERYGLILENLRSIKAIPCRGKQGIWYVEVEAGDEVKRGT